MYSTHTKSVALSLPGVLGKYVEDIARKYRLPLGAKLVPCLKVLPMGWSWGLYFCQQSLERSVRLGVEQSGLAGSVLQDKELAPVLAPSKPVYSVYVDNAIVFGNDRKSGGFLMAAELISSRRS